MNFLLSNFGQAVLEEPILQDTTVLKVNPNYVHRFPQPGEDEAFAITLWDGDLEEEAEIVYCSQNLLDGELVVSRGEEGTVAKAWLGGTHLRHGLTAESIQLLLQTGFVEGNMASELEAQEGISLLRLMSPGRTTDFFNARTSEVVREILLLPSVEEIRGALGFATATFSGTGLQDSFDIPNNVTFNPDYVKVYVDEIYVPDGYTIEGNELDGYYIHFDSPPSAGTDNIVLVLGNNFAFSVSYPGDNTVDTVTIVDLAVTTAKLADGAVTAPKIATGAVTNSKLGSSAVTNDKIANSTIDLTTKVTGVLPAGNLPDASEGGEGVAEIATSAEVATGTDNSRIVSPAGLKSKEATAANYQALASRKILTTEEVKNAMAPVAISYASSVTLDFEAGFDFNIGTLTGDITLANPTNTVVGKRGRIRLTQDATGGRVLTLGSYFKTLGSGATLSTPGNSVDFLDYDIVASNYIRVTKSGPWG